MSDRIAVLPTGEQDPRDLALIQIELREQTLEKGARLFAPNLCCPSDRFRRDPLLGAPLRQGIGRKEVRLSWQPPCSKAVSHTDNSAAERLASSSAGARPNRSCDYAYPAVFRGWSGRRVARVRILRLVLANARRLFERGRRVGRLAELAQARVEDVGARHGPLDPAGVLRPDTLGKGTAIAAR